MEEDSGRDKMTSESTTKDSVQLLVMDREAIARASVYFRVSIVKILFVIRKNHSTIWIV